MQPVLVLNSLVMEKGLIARQECFNHYLDIDANVRDHPGVGFTLQ